MRSAWAGLAALGAALTATGCSSNSPHGTATASPSPTAAGTAGSVPACVTGTWRSKSATVMAGAIGKGMTGSRGPTVGALPSGAPSATRPASPAAAAPAGTSGETGTWLTVRPQAGPAIVTWAFRRG
jgi:hypothetical protein